jgi:hypothetical protein
MPLDKHIDDQNTEVFMRFLSISGIIDPAIHLCVTFLPQRIVAFLPQRSDHLFTNGAVAYAAPGAIETITFGAPIRPISFRDL